tara:strand:- start:147 stop:416 length:270 start_codon:yes stop_codon:yes gene_type:complete
LVRLRSPVAIVGTSRWGGYGIPAGEPIVKGAVAFDWIICGVRHHVDFKIRFTCGVGAGGGRGEGGGLIMLLCVGVSLKQLMGISAEMKK